LGGLNLQEKGEYTRGRGLNLQKNIEDMRGGGLAYRKREKIREDTRRRAGLNLPEA